MIGLPDGESKTVLGKSVHLPMPALAEPAHSAGCMPDACGKVELHKDEKRDSGFTVKYGILLSPRSLSLGGEEEGRLFGAEDGTPRLCIPVFLLCICNCIGPIALKALLIVSDGVGYLGCIVRTISNLIIRIGYAVGTGNKRVLFVLVTL